VGTPAPPAGSDSLPPLFGTKVETTSAPRIPKLPPDTLQLILSAFGGEAAVADSSQQVDGVPDGAHAGAEATLIYQRRKGRAAFGARGQSMVRRDVSAALTPMWQQGAMEFSYAGTRQQFHARQGVTYAPYYQFGGLNQQGPSPIGDGTFAVGEAAAAHGDFANSGLASLTTTTDIDWNRQISRRFGLSTALNLRRTTFDGSQLDLTARSVGARLTRRFTRFIAMRTGYTYREGNVAFGSDNQRLHELDLGVDYSRPVSRSQRTTVSFGSGAALTPHAQQPMTFNVTGNAFLNRQIGRTWQTRVGFTRSVMLLEGFVEPVLSNAVTTNIGGMLRRGVTLSSSLSYSLGSLGQNTSESHYTNWTGSGGVSIALGRRAAVETQCFFAGYRFDGDLALAPGLSFDRQRRRGVRVSLTLREFLVGNRVDDPVVPGR
jgi:hypothetical protein